MQFTKSIALAIAALAGCSLANDRVQVANTDININTIGSIFASYANDSLYVGHIFTQTYAEPYIVASASNVYFTSYHQYPTGDQALYIYANETLPVSFSVPHSGYVPPAATYSGISFTGPNGTLAYNGSNNFAACQVTAADKAANAYQVYWVGDGLDADWDCLPTPLELTLYSQC